MVTTRSVLLRSVAPLLVGAGAFLLKCPGACSGSGASLDLDSVKFKMYDSLQERDGRELVSEVADGVLKQNDFLALEYRLLAVHRRAVQSLVEPFF